MPDTPHLDLSFLLLRAFYDLQSTLQRLLAEQQLDDVVQPGMGPVLYALYFRDDCTVSELSERVQLAASTLTNSLKRMEKLGLVSLVKDKQDRRATRVRLAAKSKKLKPQMSRLRREVRRTLRGDLNDEEFDQLLRLLGRVIHSMELDAWEAKRPLRKVPSQ